MDQSESLLEKKRWNLTVLQHVATNWAIILAGLVLNNGLGALTLIIVARQVAPNAYGQYLACYALASFAIVIPGFGMDAWLLTLSGISVNDAAEYWRRSHQVRIQLLSVWVLLMLMVGFLLPSDTYPLTILLPTVIGVALDSLALLAFSFLRTQNSHGMVTALQSGTAVLLVTATLLLPTNDNFIFYFALARALISLVVALLVIYYAGKRYWQQKSSPISSLSILKQSKPFLLAELASAVYVKADVTLLSIVIGSEATGVYGPAITILQATFLVSRALFFFMVPMLSRTYVVERARFAKASAFQLLIHMITGLGLSFFLGLFASNIITLIFGESYQTSSNVLLLLSPIPFVRSLNFALGAILTSSGQQTQRTKVQVVAAVANVLGNLLVVARFGLVGVSIVYVASEIILFAGYMVLIGRSVFSAIRLKETQLTN